MATSPIKRARFLITFCIALLLVGGTILAIQIAKGYRPDLKQMSLNGMGLLSTTSYPKSAQVFINDRLTTVTDDTLYLNPDTYEIKIIKNGFHPWTKTIPIKREIVSLTQARLFPVIPAINPLTFYNVQKALLSPDGNKIVYILNNSPFTTDNGVYVLSLSNNFLGSQITQIADLQNFDFTKAEFSWSPDSSQILSIITDGKRITSSRLLNAKSFNNPQSLTDETIRLPLILNQWQEQIAKINTNHLATFPEFITQIASQSAVNVYFSPDGEKLFYTSTGNTVLPENEIAKNLPNVNPTTENRSLEAGKTYVYDLKEGTNYLLSVSQYNPENSFPLIISNETLTPPTPTPTTRNPRTPTPLVIDQLLFQFDTLKAQLDPISTQNLIWYHDSSHLIVRKEDGVSIIEYDGNNPTTLTSANLKENFAAPSPDGNRLIILSNLNQPEDSYNLISLDLK